MKAAVIMNVCHGDEDTLFEPYSASSTRHTLCSLVRLCVISADCINVAFHFVSDTEKQQVAFACFRLRRPTERGFYAHGEFYMPRKLELDITAELKTFRSC